MKLEFYNTAAQREAGSQACHNPMPPKSNTSFLKTLLLLALMLVGSVGVSWGTDYTTIANFKHLESDFQASGTDQLLTGNGCDMVKFSWSGIENTTETIDGNKYYKFTDNDSYVKVKFYHEYNPNAPFIAGDIVRVHLMVTDANVDPGFILKSDKGGEKTVLGDKGSANQDITVSYTLTENDINNDGSISIYRTGGGYATRYYSFEVAMKRYDHDVIMSQTTGGTATFMVISGDASCALNTPVTRANVSNNATIKLTNTPNADILFWGWQVKDEETWKASWDIQGFDAENYAVTKTTEIRPNFTEGIKINAIHKDGTMGTINVSGGGKSGTNIHITPYPGTVTFTATPNAGYRFVGWYEDVDCNNLATSATTLTYTNDDAILTTSGTINRWAKFERIETTHPANITCVNNTIDLSKITTGSGATYNPGTHQGSITANYGSISVTFASAIDLHELSTLTLAGTNVEKTVDAGAFNCINFYNGSTIEHTAWSVPANLSTLDEATKEKLKNITKIEFVGGNTDAHKGDFTIESITLNFGGSHTKKSTPVLNGGTTAEMVIAAGCPFTLSATNGYWREYNSDFSGEKAGGLISGEWNPQHKFTEGISTVGHYYFGIQDNSNTNCNFGVNHHSDLTRVHVKVVEATPNTSCENAHIELSNIHAYGNTTFNGSTGQFVVNDYNQYGNGLQIAFAEPQNFSNAKTITINGAEFKNPNMREVDSSEPRWPQVVAQDDKTVINLNNKNNANYDAVTFFELRDIPAGTYTISSIDVEFDHTPATPQLINGTTATMVIPIAKETTISKNFTLSANNADVTYWHQYDAKDGNVITTNFSNDGTINNPNQDISSLTQGTYYFAAERHRVCEFGHKHDAPEKTWVTVDVEPQGTMPDALDRIKQPTYGTNHAEMAKEYIAIANLKASNGDDIAGWNVTSVTGTEYHNTTDDKEPTTADTDKQKIAYVLGNHAYKVSQTDGLCISQWGRAGLVENQTEIPTRATLIFKAAGTDDFYVLLKNYLATVPGQPYGHDRRHIKVWYTNDQNVDASGERKLMPFLCADNDTSNDFYFYGERGEDNSNGLSPLHIKVRLQHLGKDGTCNVFITYEDDAADENVWVKGIVVKRPDLSVTIGRTDGYGCNEDGTIKPGYNNNVKITPFGKGNPYQWNFGTAGFYAKTDPNGGDDKSNETKKVNEFDGRTYICGEGPNGEVLMDHLLVFSDGQAGGDKAEFDGRKKTNGKHAGYEDDEDDNNEHIELKHPTKYEDKETGVNATNFTTNRRSFIPLLSDGIKVNVTGSGWFTIACAAPNGDVKMKVLSSTNGGTAYINLLREFIVKQSDKTNKETDWQTFRVYLKAHQERANRDAENKIIEGKGFWDGPVLLEKYKDETDGNKEKERIPNNGDPEQTQMSLYVVFEPLSGVDYKTRNTDDDAQLNIHYLQWVNELPADYVFQREEDPKLLNSLQSVVSNGTAAKPGLYWQAGTSKVEKYTSVTPSGGTLEERTYDSAYNSVSQQDREAGQNSGSGSVSESLGCVWDIASEAHTVGHSEKAYWEGKSAYTTEGLNEYDYATAINPDKSVSNISREFASPISGSFFRLMPMKNQYIKTHVVTKGKYTDEELKAAEGVARTNMLKEMKIYIIDETGKPIPYHSGADAREANKSTLDADAREHGWVAYAQGLEYESTGKFFYPTFNETTGVPAVRIDIAALAGKEYFLCSNGTKISLARLDATSNDYRIKDIEKTSFASPLVDNTDNSSAISTAMNNGVGRYVESVQLKRTFTRGMWASLVLPFSLNEKKFEEIFGEGAQCLHFTDVDQITNTVKFTRHFYNMVVAGRPIFVRPMKGDVIDPVFTDVTLSAKTVTNTSTPGGFEFVATYDNAAMKKNDLYINRSNQVKYLTTESGTYAGMRAFIRNNAGFDFSTGSVTSSGTDAKAVFLNFFDGDESATTGIEELVRGEFGENVVVVTKSTKVYDLSGRIVGSGAELGTLPAGVYVVNGKKYIVK